MSDQKKQYRSVLGAIQFDPRDGEAAGKSVRNIVVNATGFKEQAVRVSATVWPSHADVPLAKGDIVFLEGPYTRGKGKRDDGTEVIYHNLSVTRLAKLGAVIEADRPAVVDADDDADDDDIPF